MVLLYRSPVSSLNSFHNNWQSLISVDKVNDIGLGDFNKDFSRNKVFIWGLSFIHLTAQ